ncbi:MAG: hypothetical protein OEY01_02750 [Desulfobulbaceae bacterium]|nr:hypothetical protein [Desulfobulbaceae bacterium]HIJ78211.1 hypothetical protein [Deltaproteobacteria bacterium]
MIKKIFTLFCLLLLTGALAEPARAGLTTELQTLVSQGAILKNELSDIAVGQGNTCSQLGSLNSSFATYLTAVELITSQLSAPLSISLDDLAALDDLSSLTYFMSADSTRISWELRGIEDSAELFEYRAALSAMLTLSKDIGTMANRILEMADRILVMTDNIGAMADRILITQQLQNSNIALTQNSLGATQQNMVILSDSISSIAYNLSLGLIQDDTNALVDEMGITTLTSDNMASELDRLAALSSLLLANTVNLYTWMSTQSSHASHYINGDTLTALGDLSAINLTLAQSLELYADTINQLSPLTQTAVLAEATAGMLQLTADIGQMANRIMEMADKIIIMADNIGLMADNIVATQELQQTNIELTESSLLTAQNTTISVIKNMGL